MDKRKTPRFKRRVPLEFWDPEGSGKRRRGFTINVSETGLFIATNSPISVGTLITIELTQVNSTVRLDGEVRSAIRVDPALRRLKQSGMGVRLLTTEEKMRRIIKPGLVKETNPPVKVDDAESTSEDDNGRVKDSPLYSVYIDSTAQLSEVFDSHIRHGGIFVPTSTAADIEQMIRLEFLFRWEPGTVFQTTGTVVKNFSPAEGGERVGGVVGMGVEFSDPPGTIAHFRQLLDLPDETGLTAERR